MCVCVYARAYCVCVCVRAHACVCGEYARVSVCVSWCWVEVVVDLQALQFVSVRHESVLLQVKTLAPGGFVNYYNKLAIFACCVSVCNMCTCDLA